jgi:hypothetical protein
MPLVFAFRLRLGVCGRGISNMRILGMALCATLSGCIGPLVPVTHVDDTTAVELDQTVRTFAAMETPPSAPVLGPITATSCKNKIWDKDATAEDATNQLRLMARQRGANAVGNLTCENQEGTSLAKNCWASVTCTGTAIKFSEALPNKRRQ